LSSSDARATRADAARNRDVLLAVATRVFASSEAEPSMRAIAREADVGIATLYRHFPTRESLVDAVYQDQVKRLTLGARELLSQLPPAEAMRRWMDLFGDWLATKHGMLGTLLAMIESGEIADAQTRTELLGAITAIPPPAAPPATSAQTSAPRTLPPACWASSASPANRNSARRPTGS
jgi:AcrR family transcriptional regulator